MSRTKIYVLGYGICMSRAKIYVLGYEFFSLWCELRAGPPSFAPLCSYDYFDDYYDYDDNCDDNYDDYCDDDYNADYYVYFLD